MRRDLAKMANTDLGILVIGGGILGAGIARDSALRGIKCGLVEKGDFGCGTTSRSTMLVHGGLRYLEDFHIRLVRESLRERGIIQEIAGEITKPIPFIIPVYKKDNRGFFKIKMGLKFYDFLAGSNKIQSHQILTPEEIKSELPNINDDGLIGGVLYYDCQTNPERLILCNLFDAFEHGAQSANYCEAVSLLRENGKVIGAVVKDLMDGKSYEIKSRVVINVTGPWLDKTLTSFIGKETHYLRPTKGIHLVMPKLTEKALLVSIKQDNRVFFIIPWGNYSIVGTTDTDFKENLDEVHATQEDIDYLLKELNRIFPQRKFTYRDIQYTYAGVRPLIYDEHKLPSEITREHNIIEHSETDTHGLITIVGGKLTTYRLIAEEVLNIVHKRYNIPQERKCKTGIQPMLYQVFPTEQEAYLRLQDVFEKSPALVKLLKEEKVVKSNEYKFRVTLACELEMARTPTDFLLRRTQIGYRHGFAIDILTPIADSMANFLGWKPEEKQLHIDNYKTYVHSNFAYPR